MAQCIDLQGRMFATYHALCIANDFDYKLFLYRRRAGWSIKKILSTPKIASQGAVDHLGNKFKSIAEMCAFYNVSQSVYSHRLKKGHTLKDALTLKPKPVKPRPTVDHEGRKFMNVEEMCNFYCLSVTTFLRRVHLGWSLEKALTTPPNTVKKKAVDHDGNTYPSFFMMLAHFNLTPQLFTRRKNAGWTLKRILTTPMSVHLKYKGHIYKTIDDMCYRTTKLSPTLVTARLAERWKVADALNTPAPENYYEDSILS